ncbi:carbon monoxide dehydrogenase subunit G [Sphingopyxis sp. CCNWLW253]|uniref:SRPBCC family protein n=1 Tax=unclassified Sphingopyxis TaxID=2614943 RepID=UPI003012ED9A
MDSSSDLDGTRSGTLPHSLGDDAMEMTGEQFIAAPKEAVWNALNDPEILRQCVPGCEQLVRISDTEMEAVAVVKVGPISARFQGRIELGDLDPPHGYRIQGEGQGGVAGHARGGATVRLAESEGGTLLHYEVEAQIGGRLAQLGGRMIDATAKSLSAAFFRKFAEALEPASAAPAPVAQLPNTAVTPRGQRPGTSHSLGSERPAIPFAAGALLGAAMVFWLRRAGAVSTPATSLSPEMLVAIQMLLVGGLFYLLGRQSIRP